MKNRIQRNLALALVVVALGVSVFGGSTSDAKESPNGGYSTNSVTWCRTC